MEGPSAKIEDKNVVFMDNLLVKTVGNSSGCGLVDDMEHADTRDRSGILGGLSLGVVEVCQQGIVEGTVEI